MPRPHQNVPMGEIAIEEPHCSWYKKLFFFIHQGFSSCRFPYRMFVVNMLTKSYKMYTWNGKHGTTFEYESASSLLSFPPLNMQTEHRFFLESFVCHEKSKLCIYVCLCVYIFIYNSICRTKHTFISVFKKVW